VTSGLNLEMNRALNLLFFKIIGKEAEFRTPVGGCRLYLTAINAGAPVAVFFLFVTVLKPYESTYTVETFGEGTAGAASKVNH
jgi:hypothetical protein